MNPEVRIDPGWLRAVAVDTAVLVRALEPGQRLAGRVLQATGENQFLRSFGGRRMIAQSALPLVPGQPITVDVVKTGALVELRMLQAARCPPRITAHADLQAGRSARCGRLVIRSYTAAVSATMRSTVKRFRTRA